MSWRDLCSVVGIANLEHGAYLQVILEVPANTGKLASDFNPEALEFFALTDTREHQDLG